MRAARLSAASLALLVLAACGAADDGAPALTSAASPVAADMDRASAEDRLVRVRITARTPEGVGPVYVAGNHPSLGPWRADGVLMQGEGPVRVAELELPEGYAFEFKVTLGSWEREGLGPSGTVMPNFTLEARQGAGVEVEIADFKKDPLAYIADWQGSGVLGRLDYWTDVTSEFLPRARHVSIWTPPGYGDDPEARYPVIYAHDGQNLFDPRIANTGVDWGVDEAIVRGIEAGTIRPAIVVGVWSTDWRWREYAPSKIVGALPQEVRALVVERWGEPVSDDYLRFLAQELKPRVDAQYRTLTGPEDTYLMGSSMGGLISLYGVAERPDVFGAAACLSIHWPLAFPDEGLDWPSAVASAFESYLARSGLDPSRARLWFDQGTLALDAIYGPYRERIVPMVEALGFRPGDTLEVRVYEGTEHNEAAWRARLDEPLAFLLAPREG